MEYSPLQTCSRPPEGASNAKGEIRPGQRSEGCRTRSSMKVRRTAVLQHVQPLRGCSVTLEQKERIFLVDLRTAILRIDDIHDGLLDSHKAKYQPVTKVRRTTICFFIRGVKLCLPLISKYMCVIRQKFKAAYGRFYSSSKVSQNLIRAVPLTASAWHGVRVSPTKQTYHLHPLPPPPAHSLHGETPANKHASLPSTAPSQRPPYSQLTY